MAWRWGKLSLPLQALLFLPSCFSLCPHSRSALFGCKV